MNARAIVWCVQVNVCSSCRCWSLHVALCTLHHGHWTTRNSCCSTCCHLLPIPACLPQPTTLYWDRQPLDLTATALIQPPHKLTSQNPNFETSAHLIAASLSRLSFVFRWNWTQGANLLSRFISSTPTAGWEFETTTNTTFRNTTNNETASPQSHANARSTSGKQQTGQTSRQAHAPTRQKNKEVVGSGAATNWQTFVVQLPVAYLSKLQTALSRPVPSVTTANTPS
jgi:hypothetical protein